MQSIKDISRLCKSRLIEKLCDGLLTSGHFRRTVLRRLFQNHVSSSALAYVAFPDHVLIVDPRDHMIAFSLVSGKTWQRYEFDRAIEIAKFANALQPGGWFLDIGANIGTQTIYALLSGKFRGVVAIEPEPRNLALLRRNIELNGFTSRVRVIEAAASSYSGTADLMRDAENFGAHSIEPGHHVRRADTIAVRTRTVDDILASLDIAPTDIGMALIDVEGHEFEVLKGMSGLRAHGVPIVAEITGKLHGTKGIAQLRDLLSADYRQVAALRDNSSDSNGPPERDLATYDFGLLQRDVMFYNAGSIAVSQAI